MIHASFKARDEAMVKPIYESTGQETQAYRRAHRTLMDEFGDALAAEYLGKLPEAVAEKLSAEVYGLALSLARSSEDFAQIEFNYLSFAGLAELTSTVLIAANPQAPVDIVAEFFEDAEAKGEHYERGTFEFGAAIQNFVNGKLDSRDWRQEYAYFENK